MCVISFLLLYFVVGVATEREEADQLCEAACTMGRVLCVCCVCCVCYVCVVCVISFLLLYFVVGVTTE